MPKSNAAKAPSPDTAPDDSAAPTLTEQLQQRADTLFRTAAETCRQHRRYAALVELGAREPEQKAALKLASFCDTLLVDAIASYERCGARVQGLGDAAWWHKANALWHASREFARRHLESDRAARRTSTRHAPTALAQLNMEYELEASALLALRQSMDAYRKVRPMAEC
jgi:hypothetical protein